MASAQRAASQVARQRRREEVRAQREVVASRTVANPEKKRHLRAALAEEGILAYLFRNQDRAEALEQRLPPEKWITPWGRRVYTLLLGKTKQRDGGGVDSRRAIRAEPGFGRAPGSPTFLG